MKKILLIIIISIFLSGCETTSTEKGLIAGGTARIIFDSESDKELFREIQLEINQFLASGRMLTEEGISRILYKYEGRISPTLITLVVDSLMEKLNIGDHDEEARQFLIGLSLALEGV